MSGHIEIPEIMNEMRSGLMNERGHNMTDEELNEHVIEIVEVIDDMVSRMVAGEK